jgi:hypothetical protein
MPYVPKEHEKYNLLPSCQKCGGEVFSYPSDILSDIEKLLPEGEGLIPYGYKSYYEYDVEIDSYITKYGTTHNTLNILGEMLTAYKELIHQMNVKENWSILKYVGETTPDCLDLTPGRFYYWPCSIENPKYEGVIDDEEFTSYLYVISAAQWVIAEDPLGMAASVLNMRF